VMIPGNSIREDRTVVLNAPARDEVTGQEYRTNDVQRTRLKVALDDVPSSGSFRVQQLAALSEAFKVMPQNMQIVALPHMLSLMDLPDKEEIIKAVREASQQQTPEQIQKQTDEAVQAALVKAGAEVKMREVAMKERKTDAEIEKLAKEAVNVGITSTFAAMQAAEKIAMNPAIAPVGDVVMQQAGWRQPSPGGQDPDIPAPTQAMQVEDAGGLQGDTSPTTPDLPPSANIGVNEGIETLRAD